MFILKKGHQPRVYVPLRALFLVSSAEDGACQTSHSRRRPLNSEIFFDGQQNAYCHSEEALNTGKLPLGVAILALQIRKFDVLAWLRNCYNTQVISLVV